MYEILVHSFCREHGDRNSISGCASKLIFPTAATCFLVIWDFASLFLCVSSGGSSLLIMVRT